MSNHQWLPTHFQATGVSRFIPSHCAVCGAWPSHGVCGHCYGLYQKEILRCQRCAIELPAGNRLQICGHCLATPFTFDRTMTAVPYTEPWSKMLQQFKFYQHSEKARVMARLLCDKIRRSGVPMPDFLIPVPNARNRMQERGYNQAWELSKALARLTKVKTLPYALVRAKEESSQTQRKRKERFKALKNAFTLDANYMRLVKDQHIALVDDVMTTGATLESAAKTLKQAAPGQISVWVFARTPLDVAAP